MIKLFLLLLSLMIMITFSIHHKNHQIKSRHNIERTYKETCEHLAGQICNRAFGVGEKCCKKSHWSGRYCDSFGC